MVKKNIFICIACLFGLLVRAEDGSRLWLRYEPLPESIKTKYQAFPSVFYLSCEKGTKEVLGKEWQTAYRLLTGTEMQLSSSEKQAGWVFKLHKKNQSENPDAYRIRSVSKGKQQQLEISASQGQGLLYGMFHVLRLLQSHADLSALDLQESPSYERRILNHWDNIDGTVERGYAGHSLWDWDDLPGKLQPRYEDYARANASIGINGTVLNNVNANPLFLSSSYLEKTASLARVFRPYGIKVYLAVNFSSPTQLGGLPTSDPLDKDVRAWWKQKAKEIYALVPDFGGFLVKANSEGLPGPQDYGRTHADGANMLAEALQPYGGIVMWRAFVYQASPEDRAKQAYNEFVPLDGKFLPNVIVQVKNGPIDFQPREPINPLFGAMRQTPLMVEFQITQEYLGFSEQLVYLVPLFKECLDTDTYCKGEGSSVLRTTDKSLFLHSFSAIAGVANIGKDTNWCGHHFAQANWYAYGRLAWNARLSSDEIAREWLKMTFTNEPGFLDPMADLMNQSREVAVNYMMPLGLHHIFAWDHHYGPEPWCTIEGARSDWLPSYYHKAGSDGLGFDRTSTGSKAVDQYFYPLSQKYEQVSTCPENLLLWFHHLPWDYTLKNGRTLWTELCYRYTEGVDSCRDYQKTWDSLQSYVDAERFLAVQYKLKRQTKDAVWWRDACLLYFQTFSSQPIPYELERPVHDLEELKLIKLDMKHHN